ncbi:restriction endonuclease subunit S [Ruminococcus sp.]|uniref:restriction endonuclease subunit S n=1 Tax=Ruminococcus sp. TaxID=41978 RepID=UPI00386DFB75
MNEQIKQRIEQLNNGEVPRGYKKTEIGVFPSDWVTDKTLGDLFDFYGGLSKSRDELGEEGYAYLHYGDLHRGTFNTVSIDQYEQLPKCDISLTGKEKCLMKDGDVAFLDASEDLEGTSRAVLIDNPENKPFIAGLHIIYGKAKNNSLDKWFKQYITSSESVKKQFQRLAVGFKVYGVNRDTIPRIRVAFPSSKKEQSRIAEILMKWDEAIELYEKQIDALTCYKAVCLRKMFPAKGQNVPEWRFQGFSDDWEQRKLGDYCKLFNGDRSAKYPDAQDLVAEGIPFINAGDLVDGHVNLATANKITRAKYDELGGAKLRYGDIVYCLRGTLGKNAYIDNFTEGTVASSLVAIRPKNIDGRYLFHVLNSDIEYRQRIVHDEGAAQPNLSAKSVSEFVIPIPDVDEQNNITCFLNNLSNLITLHQRKKEALINQRKTLQQYLLNGIVRVR